MQDEDKILKENDKIKRSASLTEQPAYPELPEIGIPTNAQGGIDGCLIATVGLGCIIGAIVLAIISASLTAGWVFFIAVIVFLGGLWLIIYPLIRLLFFGRDSVAPAVLTTIAEAVILSKVAKSSKKRSNR